jgi:hypothetical protein
VLTVTYALCCLSQPLGRIPAASRRSQSAWKRDPWGAHVACPRTRPGVSVGGVRPSRASGIGRRADPREPYEEDTRLGTCQVGTVEEQRQVGPCGQHGRVMAAVAKGLVHDPEQVIWPAEELTDWPKRQTSSSATPAPIKQGR